MHMLQLVKKKNFHVNKLGLITPNLKDLKDQMSLFHQIGDISFTDLFSWLNLGSWESLLPGIFQSLSVTSLIVIILTLLVVEVPTTLTPSLALHFVYAHAMTSLRATCSRPLGR